jgi:HD-GYP domain-containing protein (c-di-GMP phosphodiesterase class II)
MAQLSVQNENDYEDLLGLWADLESGLSVVLGSPDSVLEFESRICQYGRWMQSLLQRDPDLGLYLLFQLATNSSAGYSASHALICTVLCQLIADELQLAPGEYNSLVRAALTMNIGMTRLQDQLALQTEKLSPEQSEAIRNHGIKGQQLLTKLGISDALWLGIVADHHGEGADDTELRMLTPDQRLTRILRVVDHYAAMISPRKSREGRSVTESVRSILSTGSGNTDEVGHALVRAVGMCPPGTYVQLEDKAVAVVTRRSSTPDLPHVAVVVDAQGTQLRRPFMLRTVNGSPRILKALAASVLSLERHHHLVLQLGAQASQQA